jgi:hypothetical protein
MRQVDKSLFGPVLIVDQNFVGEIAGNNYCDQCFETGRFVFIKRADGLLMRFLHPAGQEFSNEVAGEKIRGPQSYVKASQWLWNAAKDDVQAFEKEAKAFKEEDLIVIDKGRESGKDLFYFKQKEHPFVEAYRNLFFRNRTAPFLAHLKDLGEAEDFPFVFAKDQYGRFHRYDLSTVAPNLMGEPIIYLYPEYTQEVEVKFPARVIVSKSEPPYNDGWKVIAQPDGTLSLTDRSVKRTFPYLFWEGPLLSEETTERVGHLLKKSELESFFDEALFSYGLNKKEAHDFKSFWLGKLNRAPYYFVRFWSREKIDRDFPIQINPKPDSLVRVYIDYEPLFRPVKYKKAEVPKRPTRHGFTVVEWGGVILGRDIH